jgi:hypothetical protein
VIFRGISSVNYCSKLYPQKITISPHILRIKISAEFFLEFSAEKNVRIISSWKLEIGLNLSVELTAAGADPTTFEFTATTPALYLVG